MNSLGFMLHNGVGVEVNLKEAARYYKMSADKGNTIGMHNYGVMLQNGDRITKNHIEAAYYYKMAADKGNIKFF